MGGFWGENGGSVGFGGGRRGEKGDQKVVSFPCELVDQQLKEENGLTPNKLLKPQKSGPRLRKTHRHKSEKGNARRIVVKLLASQKHPKNNLLKSISARRLGGRNRQKKTKGRGRATKADRLIKKFRERHRKEK